MKTKQLEKGIRQLIDEGVAQLFIQQPGNRKIVGTVGQLQFEVINHRLIHEYGANCRFVPRNYFKACWITTDNQEQLESFKRAKSNYLALDKDDNLVFLAETTFLLQMAEKDYPDLKLKPVSSPYPPYFDKFSNQQHKFGPYPPMIDFYKKQLGVEKDK